MTRRATGSARPRPPRHSSNGGGARGAAIERRQNRFVADRHDRPRRAASSAVTSIRHDDARFAAFAQGRVHQRLRRPPHAARDHRSPSLGRSAPRDARVGRRGRRPHAYGSPAPRQAPPGRSPAGRAPARRFELAELAHLGDQRAEAAARSFRLLQHLALFLGERSRLFAQQHPQVAATTVTGVRSSCTARDRARGNGFCSAAIGSSSDARARAGGCTVEAITRPAIRNSAVCPSPQPWTRPDGADSCRSAPRGPVLLWCNRAAATVSAFWTPSPAASGKSRCRHRDLPPAEPHIMWAC